jgi:hypothetical protein
VSEGAGARQRMLLPAYIDITRLQTERLEQIAF